MPMSAAEFRAYIERDIQDQAEVIRAANIRVG
jgi:tripartite-type tricarboxylate transporter receptor subunit TctC